MSNFYKVLNESFNVDMPEAIRADGIMKEGDFIVYNDGGEFIMYHMCDGLLWRTISHHIRKMNPEMSELVDGIKLQDTKLPVVKIGKNFGN